MADVNTPEQITEQDREALCETIGGLIEAYIAGSRDAYDAGTDGAALIDYVGEAFRKRKLHGEHAIALQCRDSLQGYSANRLAADTRAKAAAK